MVRPYIRLSQPFCCRFSDVIGSLSFCMPVGQSFSCQTDVSHLSLEYFESTVNSCSPMTEVFRSCGCKASTNHHTSTTVLHSWSVCADMLRLVFSKHDAVHYSKRFWSSLSKTHCSKSLVVCSVTTLQTLTRAATVS